MSLSLRDLSAIGLLTLTAAAGVVDAVCYFSLERVFTGNMTGNLLLLGFALTGEAGNPVNNLVAVAGFLLGALIAGRLVPHGKETPLPTTTVWALVGGTSLAAALCGLWLAAGELGRGQTLVLTALLAVVMGSQIVAVKPLGNADITTVVVTGTLANIARNSRLAGAPPQARAGWLDRVLSVVALVLGAAVGAGVDRNVSGAAALSLAAGLMLVGVVVLLVVRRRQLADIAAAARP
ncbi:YoaK family protein [Georgenia faecalis]|uniref:YoaK family protein n=1 Tax=Georgenia faecalis TaxID=2483799 RepID=UPI000FDA40C8|nr:YoaK family protein [Georgenia faecalis]